MNITVLAVGKIKEKWLKEAISEYKKRISKYSKLDIIELPDVNDQDEKRAIKQESEKMIQVLQQQQKGVVIALDVHGKMYDSLEFSKQVIAGLERGESRLIFLIAGSNGYDETVFEYVHHRIALSKLTFLHQMTRLILLEQIYRAFKIYKHETYHK